MKLKLRSETEAKYNSPWNIAVDFNVDMSFSPKEIASMLKEYCRGNSLSMDVDKLSEEVYFFTDGYSFLVSRLCKIIDESFYEVEKEVCNIKDVQDVVKMILEEKNTLFDSLIKNLENNKNLYDYVEDIIVRGNEKSFNNYNPIIGTGNIYGYFKNNNVRVAIANKIFGEMIYNYMISKLENKYSKMEQYNFKEEFVTVDGSLNIEKVF